MGTEQSNYPLDRASQFAATQLAKAKAAGEITDTTEQPTDQVDELTNEEPPEDAATKDETIVQDDTKDKTEDVAADATQGEDTDIEAAPGEGKAEAEAETVELSEETLAELAKVYGSKLLSTEAIQSQVKELIETQVQRQAIDAQRIAQEQSDVARLIEQGRTSLDEMANMLDSQSAEFEKAEKDEDYTPADVLDSEKFEQSLNSYGMSIVAEVQGRYNRALDAGILDAIRDLPTLSDEHQQGLQAIVATAQRMEGDPNQARNAVQYAATSFIKFLVNRAREAGAADERERVTSRTSVNKKVADSVAAKAAAAKLAASRGKTPPNAPANAKSEASPGGISEEAYDAAVKAGNFDEADRIVNAMARRTVARV